MKRRLQYLGVSLVAILLCLLTLVSATPLTIAASVWDYGISGMASNQTLSASELFAELYTENLTNAEKEYLDTLTGIRLVYNDAIPDSIVSTAYNAEAGTLDVSLPSYSFTATNGVGVEWIPKSATIGDRTLALSLEDGQYSCRFDGLFHSADFELELDFSWNAVIPKEAADELYTKTYTDAMAALSVITEYERTLEKYNKAKKAFLAYEAYLQALADFEYYTNVEKPAYDAAYAEYEKLFAKYQAYCDKLSAYEDWQQYWAYQAFLSDDVQAKYLAYQAYLTKVNPIKAKLNVLNILFTADSRNFNFYTSLRGPTVTRVLENKDLLIAAGAEESYINNAGSSTEALRVLMLDYRTILKGKYKSEHERTAKLYAYYTAHYKEFCNQFYTLYTSLNYLGRKSAVIAKLSEEGKLEHYYQFVGQLYITQACLRDNETLSESWMIGGKTLAQVMEAVHLLSDTNTASPSLHSMPETEVPKVDKVEQIARPTVEEVRTKPRLSDFGLSAVPVAPTPPTAVKKPDTVASATDPGDAPAEPKMDARLRAIAQELRDGKLKKRTAQGVERTIAFTTVATCPVSIRNLKTVTFYSADGKTVLDRQTLEYGSRVEYQGKTDVRNRESDARYHYAFLGWVVLPEGTAPEMVAYDNMSLYAYYLETPRFYTVTWILDGVTKTEQVLYGTVPSSPFVTEKTPTPSHTYQFNGWTPALEAVCGDVTYTGSYEAIPRSYTVTWVVGESRTEQSYFYGEMPQFEGETARQSDDYRYDFSGWNYAVTSVTEDATYVAEYRKTPLATDENGKLLSVVHTEDTVCVSNAINRVSLREAATLALENGKRLEIVWNAFTLTLDQDALTDLLASRCREIGISTLSADETGTTYRLAYLNSAGLEIATSFSASICLSEDALGGMPVGTIVTDRETVPLPEDGQATLTGSFTLRLSHVFALQVESNEPVNLTAFPLFVEAGKDVDISLIGLEFGYELVSASLVYADGSRQPLTKNVFSMPSVGVTLELQIQRIVYRVSFTVDGNVIHTAEYGLGETIQAPTAPSKESDEYYIYTFKGWTPEVGIAYGDEREMVFEAVFTTKPVGRDYQADRSFFFILLGVGIGALVLVCAGVTVTVILLRRRKRRKKSCFDVAETEVPQTETETVASMEVPIEASVPESKSDAETEGETTVEDSDENL